MDKAALQELFYLSGRGSESDFKLALAVKYGIDADAADDADLYRCAKEELAEARRRAEALGDEMANSLDRSYFQLLAKGQRLFALCRRLAEALDLPVDERRRLLELGLGKTGMKQFDETAERIKSPRPEHIDYDALFRHAENACVKKPDGATA